MLPSPAVAWPLLPLTPHQLAVTCCLTGLPWLYLVNTCKHDIHVCLFTHILGQWVTHIIQGQSCHAHNILILRCVGPYCSSSSSPDNNITTCTTTLSIPHIQKHNNIMIYTVQVNHTHPHPPPHVVKVSFPKSCSSSILIYLLKSCVAGFISCIWGPYVEVFPDHAMLYKGQSYLRSMLRL